MIAQLSVDIIGLQELDLSRRRSAGVDQTGMIAEQLGWHSYFHPAMRRDDEHYGNAVLSRYPLKFRCAVELPDTAPFFCRENRAAIEMNVETNLGTVHIINTHLGLGWRERLLQAQLFASAEWQAAIAGDAPLILLGDFNSLPGSKPYRTLPAICAIRASSFERRGPSVLFRPGFPRWPSIIFSERRAPAIGSERASLPCRADRFRSFSAGG